MDIHPAAAIFPLLEGTEFDALVEDIREHGQQQPIVVHEGMILDGRNRWRACEKLGIEPKTIVWHSEGTPEAYVISQNIMRRHLMPSQRAWIVSELCNIPQYHRKPLIRQGKSSLGGNTPGVSLQQAADIAGVSRSVVVDAKTVRDQGTIEQQETVTEGRRGARMVAREIREESSTPERRKKFSKGATKRKINSDVWANVRTALVALTSLPKPSDVVEIMKKMDRYGLVDDRLNSALRHLQEIHNEWHRDTDGS